MLSKIDDGEIKYKTEKQTEVDHLPTKYFVQGSLGYEIFFSYLVIKYIAFSY